MCDPAAVGYSEMATGIELGDLPFHSKLQAVTLRSGGTAGLVELKPWPVESATTTAGK
ncbi:MAG: hypothetical protein MK165_18705 [Pirellulaceae bacterium]|nr:hypothetical protein [Pirellulaceae bacterium]